MSAALAQRPLSLWDQLPRKLGRTDGPAVARPLERSNGGRLTLEQRLDSVWEGLRAEGAAECPVCRGRMERLGSTRCTDCGSELS
jgi:tRNA(Ile2) C34 agmatinyltransferase TiaS